MHILLLTTITFSASSTLIGSSQPAAAAAGAGAGALNAPQSSSDTKKLQYESYVLAQQANKHTATYASFMQNCLKSLKRL